jgi:hypothetical protein
MPIWTLAAVTAEPEVSLSRWRIFETAEGTRHFVGADERDHTGRVSTAIVMFDCDSLRGETESGRIYQLIGEAGWSSNADYVWERWCKVNSVVSFTDVTRQLLVRAKDDDRI